MKVCKKTHSTSDVGLANDIIIISYMKMFLKKKMIKTSTLLKATNRFSFDAPPAINCISSIQTSSIFEQTGLLNVQTYWKCSKNIHAIL